MHPKKRVILPVEKALGGRAGMVPDVSRESEAE